MEDGSSAFGTIVYAWGIPALLFLILGTIAAVAMREWTIALAFIVLWTGAFIGINIRIQGPQDWVVIERLGRVKEIVFDSPSGIYFVIYEGLYDSVKKRGTFAGTEPIQLFTDLDNFKFDFQGGVSASVLAWARYQIGDPDARNAHDKAALVEDIMRYTYSYGDADDFIIETFEAAFRPRMEALTYEEAKIEAKRLAAETVEEIEPYLKLLGAYSTSDHALFLDDIILSEEVQKINLEALEGQKEMERQEKAFAGPYRAISAVRKAAAAEGHELTFEEARQLVENRQFMETLAQTGANINFVTTGVKDIQKMVTVNPSQGS